ncbi:unnamed protein product, partial [Soboliphyme baturini]|uniref:Uncharacterized protein n=1 Tax=Soboliphyme baturini TaxID=241478 RepID=A0A183IDH7_9BILA
MLVGAVDGTRSSGCPALLASLWLILRQHAVYFGFFFIMVISSSSCTTSTSYEHVIKSDIANAQFRGEDNSRIVRWYRLYSRCSGKYLQMYKSYINARGKAKSPLTLLRVETDSYGSRIRIQSMFFGKYFCFNKKMRLASRVHVMRFAVHHDATRFDVATLNQTQAASARRDGTRRCGAPSTAEERIHQLGGYDDERMNGDDDAADSGASLNGDRTVKSSPKIVASAFIDGMSGGKRSELEVVSRWVDDTGDGVGVVVGSSQLVLSFDVAMS